MKHFTYLLLLSLMAMPLFSKDLTESEVLDILKSYNTYRIKVGHTFELSRHDPLMSRDKSRTFIDFNRAFKRARVQKVSGVSLAFAGYFFTPLMIDLNEKAVSPTRYSSIGGGIVIGCLGNKKETKLFVDFERSIRDKFRFGEFLLSFDTDNDTLFHYQNYLKKSLRVSDIPLKTGAFSTPFLLDGVPIRLGSYSSLKAQYAARRVGSGAEDLFKRSDKQRRASRGTLIGGAISTSALFVVGTVMAIGDIFDDDTDYDYTAWVVLTGLTSSVTLLSIPLRISSEKKFDQGLIVYERDLKEKYYLVTE